LVRRRPLQAHGGLDVHGERVQRLRQVASVPDTDAAVGRACEHGRALALGLRGTRHGRARLHPGCWGGHI